MPLSSRKNIDTFTQDLEYPSNVHSTNAAELRLIN